MAVLSGRPASVAEVAQPKDPGKNPLLGDFRTPPGSPSVTASPDYPPLAWIGKNYLRNPLRQFRTVGSVRGEFRLRPWRSYAGTKPETVDTDKATLQRCRNSSTRTGMGFGSRTAQKQ